MYHFPRDDHGNNDKCLFVPSMLKSSLTKQVDTLRVIIIITNTKALCFVEQIFFVAMQHFLLLPLEFAIKLKTPRVQIEEKNMIGMELHCNNHSYSP